MPKIRQRVGEENIIIMKKILFFAFIAVSLIFAGCGGPDAPGGGNYGGGYNPPATTGYIQFQNQTSDAYYVEVSGFEPFTLGAKKTKKYEFEAGKYYITVTQKDGYLLWPTVKEGSATVRVGETTVFYWN